MSKNRPSNTLLTAQVERNKFIAPHVSVDTVVFNVHGLDLNLPTSQSRTYDKDNQAKIKKSSIFRVHGADGCVAKLKSISLLLSKEKITNISVSIPKFLTGQNVWGPGIIGRHLAEVLARVLNTVKIYASSPNTCNTNFFGASSVSLRQVDLFCCYSLKDAEQVTQLMRHFHSLLAKSKRGHLTKYGSRYVRWNSRKGAQGWGIVFYDKTREVADSISSRKRSEKPHELNLPEGILKVELRLYLEELKKLRLTKLKNWKTNTAVELFEKYVGTVLQAASMQIPTMPISNRTLKGLPTALRPPFAIASLGIDLDRVYSRQSVQRHEKEFAIRGISIRPGNISRSIKVTKLLTPERAFKAEQLPRYFRTQLDRRHAYLADKRRRGCDFRLYGKRTFR